MINKQKLSSVVSGIEIDFTSTPFEMDQSLLNYSNSKINKVQERTLRIAHNDEISSLVEFNVSLILFIRKQKLNLATFVTFQSGSVKWRPLLE